MRCLVTPVIQVPELLRGTVGQKFNAIRPGVTRLVPPWYYLLDKFFLVARGSKPMRHTGPRSYGLGLVSSRVHRRGPSILASDVWRIPHEVFQIYMTALPLTLLEADITTQTI